jgi:hypothetical protein
LMNRTVARDGTNGLTLVELPLHAASGRTASAVSTAANVLKCFRI